MKKKFYIVNDKTFNSSSRLEPVDWNDVGELEKAGIIFEDLIALNRKEFQVLVTDSAAKKTPFNFFFFFHRLCRRCST